MEGKKADLIVSRAFMPWKDMLAFVRGHLTKEGCVVFLTREELRPEDNLPWIRTATMNYAANGTKRFFCAFRPAEHEQAVL